MLTFCRLSAGRTGALLRRRHRLSVLSPSSSSSSIPSDHDYLALHLPDPPPRPPASSDSSPSPSVDELAARLRRSRPGRPGEEAVIATSFGVIRLDSDNQPVVHGQFEPGLFGGEGTVADPTVAEAMAEGRVSAREQTEPWERRERDVYREEMESDVSGGDARSRYSMDYSEHSLQTTAGERRRFGVSLTGKRGSEQQEFTGAHHDAPRASASSSPTASAVASSTSSSSSTSSGDGRNTSAASAPISADHSLGFFDSQYFPDPVFLEPTRESDDAPSRASDRVNPVTIDSQPVDVFDEQYFAAAFEPEKAVTEATAKLPSSSPLRGLEKTVADGGSIGEEFHDRATDKNVTDKLDGRPDGVFEEQYFWAAFEDTDERREVESYKAGLTSKYARASEDPLVLDPRGARDVSISPDLERTNLSEMGRDRNVTTKSARGLQEFSSAADVSTSKTASSPTPAPSPPPFTRSTKSEPATSTRSKQSSDAKPEKPSDRRSALDVVREMRASAACARKESTNRGRQLKAEVTDLSALPACDVVSILRGGVLHNADDFVVLYKPAGMSIHSASERHPHCLTAVLPDLAKKLHCEQLLTVHRLDRDTSGALLLAKTPEAAHRISQLLREGRVVKTYWAIVRGEPDLPRGVLDIPVMKTTIAGKERMTLPSAGGGNAPPGAQKAVTRYRVLARGSGCSLLELTPATGVRHQLRVHLGLGLGCPVLGDHKYSRWETAVKPQRLPPAALSAFGLRAPEARHLPMHLHARALWMPGLERRVTAPLPVFFKRNLRRLKMAAGKVEGSNYQKV
ncbi:uncharacterized protein LOC122372258 [Amphibalanus amphitrite]|uniref:uncharacterized protein LOC122372258 n=1 Tax=Amphibalanus amphitrite TaxID=1232801 RepID=UPI001C91BAAC|nr:uncharacterized protein LOC122372258 [Amphibalanus amphitrite]XP_043205154.1 uncharacterized protein LOC122372258 [Amphibalanus amphitrite]XP_043205155.1 uncharacterized protein LOC122372258 [Amphibalanus amphitrite]XP_043205157.1 uncharacterized protein LOC122372258 [Amphibalanus amphitrite]XP_043205158.1 uncharacterized protein LOC122372258 [Amphibalanus amphitrite]XP_043205159.1 uncharacterized protein LOC122372258 [Amphibalanus amphitrite]